MLYCVLSRYRHCYRQARNDGTFNVENSRTPQNAISFPTKGKSPTLMPPPLCFLSQTGSHHEGLHPAADPAAGVHLPDVPGAGPEAASQHPPASAGRPGPRPGLALPRGSVRGEGQRQVPHSLSLSVSHSLTLCLSVALLSPACEKPGNKSI